jgi:predicted Fe-S protein YdhL (DUF1289 family)
MNANPLPDIETPCIKVCVVDPESGFCIGCGRNRLEIGSWLGFSPAQRTDIIVELKVRVETSLPQARRGGCRAVSNRSRREAGLELHSQIDFARIGIGLVEKQSATSPVRASWILLPKPKFKPA